MGRARRIGRFVFSCSIVAAGAVGCSGGGPRVVAAPPRAAVASGETRADATPRELAPSRRRDRRDEPGVRAAPKPLVLGKHAHARCGKLPPVDPAGPTHDLLAGRLRFAMPAAARDVAAPPERSSPEEESRIVLDGKRLGMAVLAKETYELDPDLYEPEPEAPHRPGTLDVEGPRFLRTTFPDEKLDVAPVVVGGMRAYAARPKQPNAPPGKDTALVLALLVARSDGTLQIVTFHVRGDRVRDATGDALVGCTRMAERLAATITAGSRELDRSPGTRRVSDDVVVRVPADYVAVTTPAGARIYKLRPLSLDPGGLTIAVGGAPAEPAPADADRTVAGTLLGRAVAWRGRTSPTGTAYLFAAAPVDGARWVQVVLRSARQPTLLDEMRGVAETLGAASHPG